MCFLSLSHGQLISPITTVTDSEVRVQTSLLSIMEINTRRPQWIIPEKLICVACSLPFLLPYRLEGMLEEVNGALCDHAFFSCLVSCILKGTLCIFHEVYSHLSLYSNLDWQFSSSIYIACYMSLIILCLQLFVCFFRLILPWHFPTACDCFIL